MMEKYWQIFINGYGGYASYLYNEIIHPHWGNYFYWLIVVSLIFFFFELIIPWRAKQKTLRKDFWLDFFYMFFNFFLFSLILYNAVSMVFVELFKDFLSKFGIQNLAAIEVSNWPVPAQLFILFILRDFIQWNIHRLLHKVNFLWQIHKVHHSVREMGFAAHLRYHFMENVVYRFLEYLPLAMIGFGIDDFFLVHLFTLSMGHFNHSNIKINIGLLKYIFNNPQMHLWHHAKHIPDKSGVNFGLTLSLWDYIFGTAYQPYEDPYLELGFEDVEKFPEKFIDQQLYPFK